jgi:hypothetical protein
LLSTLWGDFPADEANRFVQATRIAVSAKNKTAEAVERAITPNCGLMSAPMHLLSDNESQFVNHVIEKFTELVGVSHVTTTPYSHEANSSVERVHVETLRHLSGMVHESRRFDKGRVLLPLVQRILNNNRYASIGTSPSNLLFGEMIPRDNTMFLKLSEQEQTAMNMSEYARNMLAAQTKLVAKAQELLKMHDQQHSNSEERPPTQFQVGAYVLFNPAMRSPLNKPRSKLETRWVGPRLVVKSEGAAYWIKDLISSRVNRVHVSQLKLFRHHQYTNPTEEALKDSQEFVVERVLQHKGTLAKKSCNKQQLTFLIRWLGYDEKYDTWAHYENMKNILAVHKYLHEKGADHLIPPANRREQYDYISSDTEDGSST